MDEEQQHILKNIKREPIDDCILFCYICQKPECIDIMSERNQFPYLCSMECEKQLYETNQDLHQDQDKETLNMNTQCNRIHFSNQWESTSYHPQIELITTCIYKVKYYNE